MRTYSLSEVSTHTTEQSCWVILNNEVFDVTAYLTSHPGGVQSILALSGQDATEDFEAIHPSETLQRLRRSCHIGRLSGREVENRDGGPSDVSNAVRSRIEDAMNLNEVESLARTALKRTAWSYFSAASDDQITKQKNSEAYQRVWFRPRVFVPCTDCDLGVTLLGNLHAKTPFFIAPAALGRLAHPSGEYGIARACQSFGTMQVISNSASMSPEDIVKDGAVDQIFGWQLYVQSDHRVSETMLARISAIPAIKFVVLTLDATIRGKWEQDIRLKQRKTTSSATRTPDTAEEKKFVSSTATDLDWDSTIAWLEKQTKLPIVLKGIQCAEDAIRASKYPCVKGIILSNHGGRSLDGSPPPLHILAEMRRYHPSIFRKVDVWIDGGIKRGTDVVKALCMGAKAVGIGRAPLYGLAVGGQSGVEHVLGILKDEVETALRFLGVRYVQDLDGRYVNTKALEQDVIDVWDLSRAVHKL